MNEETNESFISRMKFDIRKDFTGTPVIFLVIDDEVGKRISFYPDPSDNKALEIFNKLTEDKSVFAGIEFDQLVNKTQWGIEIFADDICVNLIFNDDKNNRGKFKTFNEDMYFNFVNFMD